MRRWERRELGRELRVAGLSYREIAQIIPVAKGTLSLWCRDLELTPDQRERLRSLRPDAEVRRSVGMKRRQLALQRHEALRHAGRLEAARLARDPAWIAGTVAYWAEGAKRSNALLFSNSDPGLIILFLRWGSEFLEIAPERYSARMHLHRGQDEEERLLFWSAKTGLRAGQFGRAFIKPEGTGHRKNVLYNGTLLVRVRTSADLLHRVEGWIDHVRVSQARSGNLNAPGR